MHNLDGSEISKSSNILVHACSVLAFYKDVLQLCIHCNENPNYVFPERELRGLSPDFHIHVSVSDLYISWIVPHIFKLFKLFKHKRKGTGDKDSIRSLNDRKCLCLASLFLRGVGLYEIFWRGFCPACLMLGGKCFIINLCQGNPPMQF